jgi:hypothetical protein
MKANLIMDTVTSVDCAVITAEGALVGHSFNPTFFVSGDIDDTEGVVCDFSTLKKRSKAEIDDRDTGLDHKLLVPCSKNVSFAVDADTKGNVVLTTPHVVISAPTNAFVLIKPSFLTVMPKGHTLVSNVHEFPYDESRSLDILDKEGNINLFASSSLFCSIVSSLLAIRLPEFTFSIGLREEPHDFKSPLFLQNTVIYPGKSSLFRYTHGLPNSTSWGCQNIAHGHLSFVQCFGEQDTPLLTSVAWQLAMTLNGTYFCNSNNLTVSDSESDKGLPQVISYKSSRGNFKLQLKTQSRLVAIPKDTTIENLARHMVEVNAKYLQDNGIVCVYISEGLNKGSMMWVKDAVAQVPTIIDAEPSGEVLQ